MALDRIEFDNFIFDATERRLSRIDGSPVDLAGRNFDALALLIAEAGKLVSKDRFMDEVWRGVPMTDEALTQAIRSLRRALGDDATRPRFIETVPKFGYRFVAPLNSVIETSAQSAPSYAISQPYTPLQQFLATGLSGTAGGALAGLVGGLIYGFAGAAGTSAGGGALSILLVLLMLTVALATIGAAAVSFGIAAAEYFRAGHWALTSIGGAAGGLVIGAIARNGQLQPAIRRGAAGYHRCQRRRDVGRGRRDQPVAFSTFCRPVFAPAAHRCCRADWHHSRGGNRAERRAASGGQPRHAHRQFSASQFADERAGNSGLWSNQPDGDGGI